MEARKYLVRLIPHNFPRDIWIIFVTSIISSIGFSVTMPYLSLYLNSVLHIPMTLVGTILMSTLVIGATIGLYGGELSDRMGRKWIMVRSLFYRFFIFLLIGIAIYKWTNIYFISLLLVANAILFSFFTPASQAFVADLTTTEKRMPAYGLLRMGGNLGWALGPAIGGLLVTLDYAYLFFFTGFCMLIATFVVSKFTKESLKRKDASDDNSKTNIKEIISVTRDKHFLLFAIICLSIFIVWGQLVSPLSIYSVNRIGISKTQLGILFSINGFMVVVFQYFITHLIPAKRELDALRIGALIYALGYLSVGFAKNFTLLIVSMIIITSGEMVVTPASSSYASRIADVRHRGRYLGFFSLAQTFGWAFGPLLGGILLDTFSGTSLYIWGSICFLALISALGFIIFKSTSRI